ncbi:MAG: 50S ribosomal protein L10 [Armatimonadota bacterium]
MPTQEKIEKVAELREQVERSAGVYLAEYKGLNVKDVSELREQVRKSGASMIVAKNRLLKLAVQGTPAEALVEYLTGPNAVFFCETDPVGPAKAISDFARTHDVVVWKGGYIDGAVVDASGMGRVATLPSKQELLASVVGGISAPVSGLVFTLSGLVSDLVFTLESVADKKQGAGAA